MTWICITVCVDHMHMHIIMHGMHDSMLSMFCEPAGFKFKFKFSKHLNYSRFVIAAFSVRLWLAYGKTRMRGRDSRSSPRLYTSASIASYVEMNICGITRGNFNYLEIIINDIMCSESTVSAIFICAGQVSA